MPVKTPQDEHKWQKAKEIAAQQGQAGNFALTMGIYKKMKPDYEYKTAGRHSMRDSVKQVAARYLQKKAAEDRDALCRLLALLRAVQWNHLTCHWQSAGPDGYEDHLLFERIYGTIADEVDGLAEKVVAMLGGEHVDALQQASLTAHFLARWAGVESLIEKALVAEQDLQTAITAVLEEADDLSVGMENYLQGLADAHETPIYLLQQRLRLG